MPNCTPDEASATLLARREDQIGPASKQSDVDITRASHYVPQATLRRWSANGTHLYAYRILVSHPGVPEWRLHGIRGLVRQADLYTTFDGSTEGDDFERFITREIEEPGQEAIEQLLAKGRMRPADWNATEPPTVGAEVSSTRTMWLATIRHLLTNRADVICKHRWRAAEPSGDSEWPVTDHPVLTLNYYGPGQYDFGAGWDRQGSEFMLPVSPRLAVYTQVGNKGTGRFAFTAEQTSGLQRMMVERALRWVIAIRPEAWVSGARPRTVDADAYAMEQNAWRRWHQGHLDSEAEFRRDGPERSGSS